MYKKMQFLSGAASFLSIFRFSLQVGVVEYATQDQYAAQQL